MAKAWMLHFPKCCLLLVILAGAIPGCSRTWYRLDADEESYGLVEEKSESHPRWAFDNLNIYMDPRSRIYDPSDPDNPPAPKDDPESHQYMHCANCMGGYPHWHDDGQVQQVENPAWRAALDEYLQKNPDGTYVVTLDDAVRLAYMHAPDYQEQLENLYLSAMDLAFERFRFDVQFFGGNDTAFRHNGSLRSGSFGETNTLSTATDLQARKLFGAGGELLVGFANSFVWQFAGADANQTTSLLNFNLVQPLLRQGGRDVVMETLTLSERVLLANLRAMQRYRKMYYLNVAVGDFAFGGPVRRGGFFGGAGLTGFTGTQGGFGGVGQATQFGRFGLGGQAGGGAAGGGAFVAAVADPQDGFIGLVQRSQQLINQEATLQNLLREQERMEANFEAGRIDALQVDQFRASVQTQLSDLINSRNNFQGEIDQYLTDTLGLPPNLPVQFDDSYVQQFQFFDPAVTALDRRITTFTSRLRALKQPTPAQLQEALADSQQLQGEILARVASVQADLDLLDSRLGQRQRLIDDVQERENLLRDVAALKQSFEQIQTNIAQSAQMLERFQTQLRGADQSTAVNVLVEYVDRLSDRLIELSLVQARARLEAVVVDPVDLAPGEALQIAEQYRLDWMNQRAVLVDQWRLIAFVADRLESDLDVVFSGDLSTKRDNPLDFRGRTGSLAVGLQFDAPLTRVSERNQYRDVLVDYQRARRDYVGFKDFVHRTLRQHLRNLEQGQKTLELQRRQFVINMRQFDFSRLQLREPPPPAAAGQLAVPTFGPTLARNLLDALNGLQTAQNNVMNVWVQYETTRLQLLRDLGIMEVDERGIPVEVDLLHYVNEVRNSAPAVFLPPDIGDEVTLPALPLPPATPAGADNVNQGPDLREVLLNAGATPVQMASAQVMQEPSKRPLEGIARRLRRDRISHAPRGKSDSPREELAKSVDAPRAPKSPREQKEQMPWRKRFRRIIF